MTRYNIAVAANGKNIVLESIKEEERDSSDNSNRSYLLGSKRKYRVGIIVPVGDEGVYHYIEGVVTADCRQTAIKVAACAGQRISSLDVDKSFKKNYMPDNSLKQLLVRKWGWLEKLTGIFAHFKATESLVLKKAKGPSLDVVIRADGSATVVSGRRSKDVEIDLNMLDRVHSELGKGKEGAFVILDRLNDFQERLEEMKSIATEMDEEIQGGARNSGAGRKQILKAQLALSKISEGLTRLRTIRQNNSLQGKLKRAENLEERLLEEKDFAIRRMIKEDLQRLENDREVKDAFLSIEQVEEGLESLEEDLS